MNGMPLVVADTTPLNYRGRAAVQARGLLTVGTLNLIDLGDELGFLDGIEALQDLRQTTFRAEKTLLDYFEAKLKSRPR